MTKKILRLAKLFFNNMHIGYAVQNEQCRERCYSFHVNEDFSSI